MPLLLDGLTLSDAVLADGAPRQATADDGIRHMLFLDGGVVRSCEIKDWPAEQIALAARDAERSKAEQTRANIRAAVAAIKGKSAAQWSLPEMRALLAVLLEERGMLDADGGVG